MSSIQDLANYVQRHTERGACRCGRCADHPGVDTQPIGHTADMVFFSVCQAGEPVAEELAALIAAAARGEFCECNPLDGEEHSYIELGGWIGDQGLAMQFMGLCSILGLAKLMTPKMLPGLPDDLVMMMAGSGMVTMQAVKEPVVA